MDIKTRRAPRHEYSRIAVAAAAAAFLMLLVLLAWQNIPSTSIDQVLTSSESWQDERESKGGGIVGLPIQQIKVFSSKGGAIGRKQIQDLKQMQEWQVDLVVQSIKMQGSFMQSHPCVDGAKERFNEFSKSNTTNLAEELWKYCALSQEGGLYINSNSPIVEAKVLQEVIKYKNVAVLMDGFSPKSIHGSLLAIGKDRVDIAREMAKFLVETSMTALEANPLLIPQTLHKVISKTASSAELTPGINGEWYLLKQFCSINPFRQGTMVKESATSPKKLLYNCPADTGFCCSIMDHTTILMTNYPILPYSTLALDLPKPLRDEGFPLQDLPFISTVIEKALPPSNKIATPTVYERLKKQNCLPTANCIKCLKNKKGSTCSSCLGSCPCFCKAFCRKDYLPSVGPISKEITVRPPLYSKDPTRLIPRIVHQTWFEALNKTNYPHMSRFVESFNSSGWEYRFYTDEDASNFLLSHFPSEVSEAYNTLLPGAFKADLFRYCVLLIYGGVYADVDTLSGPSLDDAIMSDVGFMIPLDEPGKKVNKRMCLWNGFMASAPAHPFLKKAIETIVNNVLSRYTSVDISSMFCPDPELSVSHSYDALFVTGPCILGYAMNLVLGRDGQAQFSVGELIDDSIEGRTIFLNQNKMDMGAHRFTNVDENLIVLSTDFRDADDRDKLKNYVHYSDTRIKGAVYGLSGVYKDLKRTREQVLLS